jgi:tRNA A-37 threonylcarbamoyl transferase component Bud32
MASASTSELHGSVELTANGIRWQMGPAFRDRLLAAEGLRLDDWLQSGRARPVKQGPHRVVYRLELGGLTCYLKHNLLPDARAWLRQLVRPSKARMEYERAFAVAARRVPTVVPLAVGERCDRSGPQESFLITQGLEQTMPLDVFLTEHVRDARGPIRLLAAESLGRFLARLHDAGVVHDDLHCGNILARHEPDGTLSFYLVDLQAVRLRAPLDWQASRDNLVLFNRWLYTRTNRADRLRFWKAYCLCRKHPAFDLVPADMPASLRTRERARELERGSRASNERFWRHRDRRCLETNRYYHPVRGHGVAGHVVSDLGGSALRSFLADPDEPFRRAGVTLLKNSRSATVAELSLPVAGQMRPVIYKRFRLTAWHDPLVNRLRRPAALRSWVFGHGLRERDLPTARPLLVLHRRRRGLLREGYLLCEKIPDAVELHGFVASAEARQQAIFRLRIEQLARLIRNMHWRHLCHRDLKASNILFRKPSQVGMAAEPTPSNTGVAPRAPGPDPRSPFWLIDLVGVTRHRKVARLRRVQNLARLNASFHRDPSVTRSDRLRFLRVYLQWGLRGKQGWKGWWRQLAEATERKVARNARNGRPLA